MQALGWARPRRAWWAAARPRAGARGRAAAARAAPSPAAAASRHPQAGEPPPAEQRGAGPPSSQPRSLTLPHLCNPAGEGAADGGAVGGDPRRRLPRLLLCVMSERGPNIRSGAPRKRALVAPMPAPACVANSSPTRGPILCTMSLVLSPPAPGVLPPPALPARSRSAAPRAPAPYTPVASALSTLAPPVKSRGMPLSQ